MPRRSSALLLLLANSDGLLLFPLFFFPFATDIILSFKMLAGHAAEMLAPHLDLPFFLLFLFLSGFLTIGQRERVFSTLHVLWLLGKRDSIRVYGYIARRSFGVFQWAALGRMRISLVRAG